MVDSETDKTEDPDAAPRTPTDDDTAINVNANRAPDNEDDTKSETENRQDPAAVSRDTTGRDGTAQKSKSEKK